MNLLLMIALAISVASFIGILILESKTNKKEVNNISDIGKSWDYDNKWSYHIPDLQKHYTEYLGYLPRKKYTNHGLIKNTDMNTAVSNQEQQVESAVKYLTEKRETPSKIVELDKTEYQETLEELADLKAKVKNNHEVIRIDASDYDDNSNVTYYGKDKAISELSSNVNIKNGEIRDLENQLTILNEQIDKINSSSMRSQAKFEKLTIERLEDEFERRNKNLVSNQKKEVKRLESVISDLDENIVKSNDINKILCHQNEQYRNTLSKILILVSSKTKSWFMKTFKGLKVLLKGNNEYIVSTSDTALYIDSSNGRSYWV